MRRAALVVPLLFALGCRPGNQEAVLAVDEDGNVSGTLPDGTQVQNQDEYEAGIAAQVAPVEEMQPLALTVSTKTPDGGAPGVTIGKFRITIVPDGSYLAGCISKKFLHLKIIVDNSVVPAALVELHIVAWFENGKPCFALMNTGFVAYGWCYKICASAPKVSLKDGIKGGLTAAGVGAATATIMAILIQPVASAALAL